jgi:hypothetical protein
VACVLAVVPFAASQFLLGSNHDVRVLSPVFLPLLAGLALSVACASWLRQIPAALFVALLLGWQAYELIPVGRWQADYWDWTALYRLTASKGLASPQIAYIGAALQYNPAHISAPWVERGEEVPIDWLWNAESGPLLWRRVLGRAAQADLVLVPPYFAGDKQSVIKFEDVDNSHNAALARHLQRDPRFAPPEVLMMGTHHPIVLFVFFRKDQVP